MNGVLWSVLCTYYAWNGMPGWKDGFDGNEGRKKRKKEGVYE